MEQPAANNLDSVFSLKQVIKKKEKGGICFELNIDSFNIRAGEFVAIVGDSGCGKSTLLDMLGLVSRPDSAENFTLKIAELEKECHVTDMKEAELAEIRKSCIGYVLQTGGLLPFLTVQENIYLPCTVNGQINMAERLEQLGRRLDIWEHRDKKPQFLSGGQRQRVAIARALAHQPPIILADEPTAAVDKPTARGIIDKFCELIREKNNTLLIVTHDIGLVEDVADRIFTFDVSKKNEFYTCSKCLEQTAKNN